MGKFKVYNMVIRYILQNYYHHSIADTPLSPHIAPIYFFVVRTFKINSLINFQYIMWYYLLYGIISFNYLAVH